MNNQFNSKQDLITFFQHNYNLDIDTINHTINNTIKNFNLKNNQIIKTQEIWEKVANTLKTNFKIKQWVNNKHK